MNANLQKWSNLEVGDFFLFNNRVYEKTFDLGYYFAIYNSLGIDNKLVHVCYRAMVEKL